jgi:hypothetical protein
VVNGEVVPIMGVGVNEVLDKLMLAVLFLFTPDFKPILSRDPVIPPYVNMFTISYVPVASSLENPSSLEDASPSVALLIS